MSKKVLIVSNFHEDVSISRSNMAYKYFFNRQYDATVLYSNFSHSLKKFRIFDNKKFVPLDTVGYSSGFSFKRILSYFIYCYKVYNYLGKNYFDIVYINLPPNLIGLSILLRRRKYKELIVDIIDLWPESYPHTNLIIKSIFRIAGIFPKLIRKKTIENSDFCISESNLFYKKLNLINKNNSKVIYIKKFQKEQPNFENFSKELSIVYLGNLGNIYDFQSLLKIIKGVKKKREVFLHIIGLGPSKKVLFDNLNLNNITFKYHGASFDEKFKMEILSKCWFGFNGYKYNTEVGLSYKSVDYLSYGVPLINSAKDDTHNLVENEQIGYNFNSKDLDPIIAKLSKISLIEVKKMKKKSFKIFKKKLSGESYFTDMDYVLSKINKY